MQSQTSSGIEILGDISWGTHFCQFYETKNDLLEILVPFFKTGLDNKEFCFWIVSNPRLTVEEAKASLEKIIPDLDLQLADGNIEIRNATEWYLDGEMFNLERVISAWDEKHKWALARGYTGMRASGDTLWLSPKNWKDFHIYEQKIDDFVTGLRITVLCTYSLEKCGAAEILDVVDAHQYTIARRKGKWQMIETAVQMQALAEIKKLDKVLQRVKERIHKPHLFLDYGVAALSVIVAILMVYLIRTSLPDNSLYVSVFLCAVIVST